MDKKIYYDVDEYGTCLTSCPHDLDVRIGSICCKMECGNCKTFGEDEQYIICAYNELNKFSLLMV